MSAPWHGLAARLPAMVVLLALVAGCATPQRTAAPDVQAWTGRLALSVSGNPPQAFSAGFELQGEPRAGELTLYTPLGGVLGVMAWAPGTATLRTADGQRDFPSLDALSAEVTGASIPVTALFDWLAGKPTEVQGWQADVSRVADGRLRAQRHQPAPPADLRIAFDQ